MKFYNVLRLILIIITTLQNILCKDQTCNINDNKDCQSKGVNNGIPWQKFNWKKYIEKDWIPEKDKEDPTNRFGIHLRNSIDIGVDRKAPDLRPKSCKELNWKSVKDLPTASVIITYRDEPRSTLLRTVVSVIEQTPSHLLEEIILVDDNNDDVSVGEDLKVLEKVKVLRNDKREGLIRSRIKGTHQSKGEVLVFLDSHCEVEKDWLEPLLDRIKKNPKRLASPVIDNINLYDYSFEPVSTYLRGGFNWNLDFFWEWIPAYDRFNRVRNGTNSYKTPAIAGGLFAINRQWFLDLGTYDEGMDIWGGENIEFSLRVWMCGGEMEIVPCSKVGHIYKKRNVYSYPKGTENTTACNLKRVAEVWLDQFQQIFELTLTPHKRQLECGDVSQRKEIREKMQCKSFEWYLSTVYPELQLPENGDIAFGQIHYNQPTFLKCLDSIASGKESIFGGNSCVQSYSPQEFRMKNNGQIFQNDFCLTIEQMKNGAFVVSELCDEKSELQKFKRYRPDSKAAKKSQIKGYQLKHYKHDLCIDVKNIEVEGLKVYKCDDKSKNQRFLFAYDIYKVPYGN